MDGAGSALLPLAAGFRLRGSQARWSAVSRRGVVGEGTAEELKWSLTPGREGLSELLHH